MKHKIDSLLSQATQRGDVAGVIAMVGNREGVVYEGAFGEKALGSGNSMTVDTVAWIASMSKALTSISAVIQVERQKLNLDVPAAHFVPEIGNIQVLTGFDSLGNPLLRPPKRPITLRHLLTHTAGFSYDIWNTDMQKVQQAMGVPSITECNLKSFTLPTLFDPGERWDYGINIDWVGRMVEASSGQTLGEFMRENIFQPLGMHSTGFKISDSMRERLASVHLRGPDGHLSLFPFEIPQEPQFEMGGGGLYSTAGDYMRFLRMILNYGQLGGERILKPETVALLGVNHCGDCRVSELVAAIPLTNNAEFFPGVPKSWSLAFQINHQKLFTGRPAGGMMWAGLANSYYWIDQTNGLTGVYITQMFPFADVKSLPLYYAFEKEVYSDGVP
ncbi:MAG: serine hydrolase domain-containing protein [Gammaproteobacteria bacterium]|nr:serine hydrolase domain-containing protein [Gammaproteobacteria bacterium]